MLHRQKPDVLGRNDFSGEYGAVASVCLYAPSCSRIVALSHSMRLAESSCDAQHLHCAPVWAVPGGGGDVCNPEGHMGTPRHHQDFLATIHRKLTHHEVFLAPCMFSPFYIYINISTYQSVCNPLHSSRGLSHLGQTAGRG